MQFIILKGDVVTGLTAIGPFDNRIEANAEIDNMDADAPCVIMPLIQRWPLASTEATQLRLTQEAREYCAYCISRDMEYHRKVSILKGIGVSVLASFDDSKLTSLVVDNIEAGRVNFNWNPSAMSFLGRSMERKELYGRISQVWVYGKPQAT